MPDLATRLRPGVHVVQRDDDHVQVGVDPPARVIVRCRPDVLALLEGLSEGRPPVVTTPEATHVLRALGEAGLLETDPASGRGTGTVAVVDRGLGLAGLDRVLTGSGVQVVAATDVPALYVVGAAAPLPRGALDDWLGEGAPHLVLAGTGRPGGLRLGPLVEPGITACLRCVDAHEALLDPRRPLVVEQLAGLAAAPLDPVLLAWGLAWAAREVVAYTSGRRPLTWSATVDLDDPAPVVRRWERHPHCGCAWDMVPY